MTEPINISNYFPTLKAFNLACRQDRSITAAAQLIYRLLVEEANRSRWIDSFTLSMDELEAITHMSRHTIVDARMRLKSKGFIDFTGNPSRYTVYSAVHCDLHRSETPTPPVLIPKYNTKEKSEQKRKGEPPNDADLHDSSDDRANPDQAALEAQIKRRLKELGY